MEEKELLRALQDVIKRMTPETIEIEGGGNSWWHVCPECHGAIDERDHYCRHCGQAVTKKEAEGT